VRKYLFPGYLALITVLLDYLFEHQINITGSVLTVLIFADKLVFSVAMIWLIHLIGNAIAEWLIAKPGIHAASIDANVIRIIARVVTIAIMAVLLLKVTAI